MQLSIEDVRRIAHLARLRLSAAEEETFLPQLRQITDYFDQLAALEIEDEGEAEASGALEAPDIPKASLARQTFLDNAPQVKVPFLLVPRVKTSNDG